MTTLKRRLAVGLATAVMAVGLTGCGPQEEPQDYQPAAYGEDGKCYFVDDADEVVSLKDDDLCDDNDIAVQAPLPWLFLYMPYYSSPAYYDRHVSPAKRSVYKTTTSGFSTKYASDIKAAAPRASYKNSAGTTVKGDKVAPTRFGGGSRNSGGGGSRINCSMSVSAMDGSALLTQAKGGGGSRGGGGGGSRGSGGGSKTSTNKTNTKTKSGGC